MKRIPLLSSIVLLMAGCGQNQLTLGKVESKYVTIDDSIRVHYKTYGQDDNTICFVHGFGCDMNTWEKQFEAFRDEDMRMVFIDLPGYGRSDKPRVDYILDFFAHAIDEVLKANHIKNTVFVGHSLGIPVCRQTIMTTPHQGALVDIDGVYCFYDGTVMPETPQYVASSTMQHLVERKWWDNRQISQPVMVVCTQNSGLDPDNEQKMQALYPHLDYMELTTCGHFIHMEQPEMLNEKLKAFGENHYNANNTTSYVTRISQITQMLLADGERLPRAKNP
ncbi:MAG: alpha/beta hydrolase [Bacteroidales bacterium]|nr:alpha/beta hydrolase [Bacteroidales bacterium]